MLFSIIGLQLIHTIPLSSLLEILLFVINGLPRQIIPLSLFSMILLSLIIEIPLLKLKLITR